MQRGRLTLEYSNPEIPEGINVSKEHPLKEFFVLTLGILLAVVVIITVLAIMAETLAKHIPFEVEAELADRFSAGLEQNGPIETYLQQLAKRVTKGIDLPDGMSITVHYVDDDTINAFATLGGHIVFYRGLLEKMPNENALAMIMAHEIGHIKHRHPITSLGRGVAVGLALATISTAAGNDILSQVLGEAGLLTLLSFSREQEEAADAAAQAAVARLYGHVSGAENLFKILSALQDEKRRHLPQFFSTHPHSENRIKRFHKMAQDNNWPMNQPHTPLPDVLARIVRQSASGADIRN